MDGAGVMGREKTRSKTGRNVRRDLTSLRGGAYACPPRGRTVIFENGDVRIVRSGGSFSKRRARGAVRTYSSTDIIGKWKLFASFYRLLIRNTAAVTT